MACMECRFSDIIGYEFWTFFTPPYSKIGLVSPLLFSVFLNSHLTKLIKIDCNNHSTAKKSDLPLSEIKKTQPRAVSGYSSFVPKRAEI